jgi:hypothetical protein
MTTVHTVLEAIMTMTRYKLGLLVINIFCRFGFVFVPYTRVSYIYVHVISAEKMKLNLFSSLPSTKS